MKSIKKILAIVLVVILMATTFAACGNKTADATPTPTATPSATATPAPSPTENKVEIGKALGSLDGSHYTNEYFGFSIDLPKDWYIASREDLASLMSLTADYLKSGADSEQIDLAMQQVIPMFLASTTNPLTADAATQTPSPSIFCIAPNMAAYKSMITDTTSYLNIMIQSVKAQGLDMQFGEIELLTIDGQEMGKVTGTLTQGEIKLTQTLYAMLKGDYAVNFTLSGYSAEDTVILENAMKTLSFK